MQTKKLIAAQTFCKHHKIEFSFISSLHEFGLIEITHVKKTPFINADELQKLEKMIRLHYDLEINVEGVEAVVHLLQQIEDMQNEMLSLKNRMRLYQGEII